MSIAPTRTNLPTVGLFLYTWEAIITVTDHTGDAVEIPGAADKTVQLVAQTAGSATMSIEGSNDGTNYTILHQADGELASFTASGICTIIENPRYIRPRLTTVGSGADWDVFLLARTT